MNWAVATITVAAVAAGINAGAFFAFSNFVMPALADIPARDGAAAMQSINRFAPNPLFGATIFGAALVAVPAVVADWGRWSDGRLRWLVAGLVFSVLSFLITIAFNVPRNSALEALDAESVGAAPEWLGYITSWTRWNTARTVASAASVAAYALSLRGR